MLAAMFGWVVRRRRNHRSHVTERNPGPPGGYHFIGWSIERMPHWFNDTGMRVGTTLALWTMPRQRAASREYLRLALGREPTRDEIWRHFYAFTEYLILRMKVCQGMDTEVAFAPGHGDEVRAWVGHGKPALYGTMHVGRSDLVGFFLCNLGARVHMIRKQLSNSEDTRRLARRFERSVTFIWINDWSKMILAMNDALREGRSLAMQCDRPEYSSKRADFEFFGARRVFPFTIYHLAIMHRMPVILSYAVPDPADGARTIVYMPAMFLPREEASREENFAMAKAHYQAFLHEVEALLRKNPSLWFNFTPMNPPALEGGLPERKTVARRAKPLPGVGSVPHLPASVRTGGKGVLT